MQVLISGILEKGLTLLPLKLRDSLSNSVRAGPCPSML